MQMPYIGQIVLYAFNFAPKSWSACSGQLVLIRDDINLFRLIGTKFGGDGEITYALPNYTALAPANLQYCVAMQGVYPFADGGPLRDQAVGETTLFAGDFAPGGCAACNGQLLQMSQNTVLFSTIGTTFGGDGQSTFAVPNLTSLAPAGSTYSVASVGDSPVPVDPFIGEVRLFLTTAVSEQWLPCDGRVMQIDGSQALFALLAYTFGGSGMQFALPDLRRIAPTGTQFRIAVAGYFPMRP
jgi:microcystin-dependent protein